VYYSNIFQGKVIVHKEDVGEKVRKIMERFLDFAIIFPKDVTHCKIVGIKKMVRENPLQ